MIIKFIGAIIITLSCGLTGMYFAYKPFYRKNDLSNFLIAFEILENEINNYSSLVEASLQISQKVNDENISKMFFNLSESLSQKNGEEIEKIWIDAVNENSDKLYLKTEDYDKIMGLGRILSCFDKELEIKNIEILKKYILTSIDEINVEYGKNKRMFQSVGFLGGLVIVIALI